MKNLAFSIVLGLTVAVGACGDDGGTTPEGDPALAAVFPKTGFAGRTTRVQVTGKDANWTNPTLAFGDGITVSNIMLITPDAFYADVTVAPTAAFGARTATVTEGGSVMLMDSFTVESPITVEALGTLAQGSIVQFEIKNRDPNSPFDTTADPAGEFTNFTVTGPDNITITVDAVTDYSASLFALLDIDAAPGNLTIVTGPGDTTDVTSVSENLAVAPRTATALAFGTPVTASIAEPFATGLYEITPTAAKQLINAGVSTANQDAGIKIALLGPSGSFDDLVAFAATHSYTETASAKRYAVVWDNTGTSGYEFTIASSGHEYVEGTEAANDSAIGAQAYTVGTLVTAKFTTLNDEDWYKITVPAGNGTKKLHAQTVAGDVEADPVLQFYKGAAPTHQAFGDESSDVNFHEMLDSPNVDNTANTYYLQVKPSPFYEQFGIPLDMTNDDYRVLIYLE